MSLVRYRLHFQLLVVAAFAFWLAKDVYLPVSVSDFDFFHYGLMGFLHATALVVSLRNLKKVRLLIALRFIALVGIWSAATPILGMWGSAVWLPIVKFLPPESHNLGLVFIFITGSALGAAGYWLLVRLFWLRSLQRADCLRTVVLCVAATLLAIATLQVLPARTETAGVSLSLILTVAWWFTFSISLLWSETRRYAKNSGPATVSAI